MTIICIRKVHNIENCGNYEPGEATLSVGFQDDTDDTEDDNECGGGGDDDDDNDDDDDEAHDDDVDDDDDDFRRRHRQDRHPLHSLITSIIIIVPSA